MNKIVKKNINSLKIQMIEGSIVGSCVILFHGYGADSSDLIPLSEMMGVKTKPTWIFPEAPLEIIVAPGIHGKAWFQIDSRRIEKAMMNGEPLDMSQTVPDGFLQARKMALGFYEEIRKTYGKIIIGGFSQGAMLATDIALNSAKKPDGLIIMSGTLVNQKDWSTKVMSAREVPFIQTHGKNDVLLGYEYAENLYEFLSSAGMHGEFVSFGGGHEIPPKVIEKIGGFVSSILR